jgi:hypothetical protein
MATGRNACWSRSSGSSPTLSTACYDADWRHDGVECRRTYMPFASGSPCRLARRCKASAIPSTSKTSCPALNSSSLITKASMGSYQCWPGSWGEGEAEIFRLCILLSDQTVTPLWVRLQVAACTDKVSWLECRLGERGKHGMVRVPYDSYTALTKRIYALDGRQDEIDWVYKVTFGHRRRSAAAEGP